MNWLPHIESAIEKTLRSESNLKQEVLEIIGMCGEGNRHLYNNLANTPNTICLEIGTYMGASTASLLCNNTISLHSVDFVDENNPIRQQFLNNVAAFQEKSTFEFVNKDCFQVDVSLLPIFNLYVYDGEHYENDGFASDVMKQEADISGNNFNEMYALIQEELSPWSHRTKFYRVPSLGVTNEMIPDESLDCIFLDGDHSYGAVYSDLQFWWKKLRSGGQLLGDDWWMQDVQRAVYDFANQNGLHFEFLEKEGEGYKIFQFKKV